MIYGIQFYSFPKENIALSCVNEFLKKQTKDIKTLFKSLNKSPKEPKYSRTKHDLPPLQKQDYFQELAELDWPATIKETKLP